MTNVVEILVTAKNLTAATFTEAKAGATGMETAMSNLNKVATLGAVAMTGFLGESVHMASKFDSEMSLLSTQANVSQDKIAGLSSGVLDLTGKVGEGPDSLAEALFHVESNFESMGITSEKALKLTETAAKGATVGHADLVDVTNTLTAAVASGIPGVEDMDQAMGVLNATVGVGDMKMQDLAAAFGGGMVATVKGFGLSITDVGAALAVFGDNNIRGAAAGTQLRMSVMALANPIAGGADALKRLGLQTDTLANDMQRGGLKLALEDLVQHMHNAGVSADQQGEIITQAFGRKAGAGLNVLVGQMDRLESKYPALAKGANGFGDAWAQTQKTFAFQTKQLQTSLDTLMITLGEKLIPYVQKVVSALLDHKQAVVQVAEATAVLLAGLVAFSAVSKTVALMQGLKVVLLDGATAMGAYTARIAEAQAASVAAGGGISKLGAAFSALGTTAKVTVAASAIGLLVMAAMKLSEVSKAAPINIDRMTTSLGNLGRDGQVAGELSKTLGANLDKLGYAVDRVAGKSVGMDHFNDVMNKIFSLGMAKSNSLNEAKDQINGLDQGLADLVKAGHADLAAAALKRLQDAFSKQGGDPDKLAAEMNKYNDALAGNALQDAVTADSMGVLGKQAVTTSKALADQEMTAKGLKEAISDLNDANRSALDGMAGFEAAIDAASKAVQENGSALHMVHGQMDLTTEKARNEEGALTSLAAKTDDAALAALKNGESMDVVNAIYDRGRQKLIDYAQQMGMSTVDAKNLADQILSTPDKTAQLKGDTSDLDAKVGEARDQLNSLHNKTIYVTEYFQMGGGNYSGSSAGRFAHGGIIGGAATGGPRGGLTWVGEQGPELVRLPGGSTVIPSGQSRSMAAAAGGGEQSISVEWIGSNAGDEFMTWLRKNIRIRGGNVQTVLGRA